MRPRGFGILGTVPFDFSTASNRVDAVRHAPEGNPRGTALQQLVEEMLISLPGVAVAHRNVLAGQGEAELDLLLTNDGVSGGLEAFGRDLLVECKSSDDALSSRDVGHFGHQAELRQLPWSLLVALAGITGTQENVRAAHAVVRGYKLRGYGVLLLVEHELRALRSVEHLRIVLERKRQKMVARLRADTLTAAELRELDPGRGIRFVRGAAAIHEAIRESRERAFKEILDNALGLPECEGEAEVERARQALDALAVEIADHKENPDEDPMWRRAYDCVVDVGAAWMRLIDDPLDKSDVARILAFDIANSAPQRLNAHAGGELWTLLTRYYLEQAQSQVTHTKRSSVSAVVALCIDEMIAIDDIDPRDVFDDHDDEYVY